MSEQLLGSSPLRLLPISQMVLRGAATLRATTRLKTPDAIHAATALRENCTLFLTNDRQFRTVAGLTVTVLEEILTA
ncbi:MAG: PIN domain-containing protein [Goleter apudmare HA4340-LM2]|jgi:predicted nucleic acid-binding protein|nr:PIN domain-containing protein [Goleter apudmare HA4340-LM2]